MIREQKNHQKYFYRKMVLVLHTFFMTFDTLFSHPAMYACMHPYWVSAFFAVHRSCRVAAYDSIETTTALTSKTLGGFFDTSDAARLCSSGV